MRVEKLGSGEPEYAVVACLHGDEPCGRKAIERFLASNREVEKAVKLIVANEKALEQDKRYIDVDLNRCFPGDPESSRHEEKLAADLTDEVEGMTVLDLHSTRSYSGVLVANSKVNEERIKLAKAAGVEKIAHLALEDVDCMEERVKTVSVECGLQKSEKAGENALEVIKNFLGYFGVINHDYHVSEPEVFRTFETVRKGDYTFTAENFRKVEQGEVYAKKGEKELEAEEPFYPVLMSTDGYEEILGHKARKMDM
ncbi:MAG: succinylglutamate desuccinylase/aspartoacylase family protein [Candidatus Nanohaloarchaea archaeon]